MAFHTVGMVLAVFLLSPLSTSTAQADAAPAPSGLVYCIQIAGLDNPDNARSFEAALRRELDAQTAGLLRVDKRGSMHLFRIGNFADRASAKAMRDTLAARHPDAYVLRIRGTVPPQTAPNARIDEVAAPGSGVIAAPSHAEEAPPAVATAAQDDPPPTDVATSTATANETQAADVTQTLSDANASSTAPPAKQAAVLHAFPIPALAEVTSPPGRATSQYKNIGIAAVLVAIAIVVTLRRRMRSRRVPPQPQPQPQDSEPLAQTDNADAPSGLPRLPPDLERRLRAHERELSMVEANLLAANRSAATIYVTSCFRGEGKTTTAIHTAWGLASEGGNRVLLVDWNTGAPILHTMFSIDEAPGLLQFLSDRQSLHECLRETAYPGLWLMPYGTQACERCETFRRDVISQHIATMRESFDYVVFDGHSLIGTSTAILADRFDGVLLAVEAERTKWEVVQDSSEKIRNMGGSIIGMVLNQRRFYIPKILYGKI